MARRNRKKSTPLKAIDNRTNRAIGIVRVSTAEQANEERYSIPHQKAHIAEECRRRGFELIYIFEFVQSGAKVLSRSTGEQEKILKFIEDNNISYVIVHELDRLARSMTDTLLFTDELAKRNVALVSVHDPVDTSTPQGIMQMQILAVFAEYFRKQLAGKVMGSMIERAREGKPLGKTPYGYTIGPQGFEVVPPEAEVVKKIFRLYVEQNLGMRGIAVELNRLGLRTRKGNQWSHSTVRDILENEVYTGRFVWDKDGLNISIENNHTPIIDREIWEKAQIRRNTKNKLGGRAQNQNFLLSGLLKCGHCTDPEGNHVSMAGRTNRKGKYCYKYYRCNNYASKGTCQGHEYRADRLEKLVLEDIELLIRNGPGMIVDRNIILEDGESIKQNLELYERRLAALDTALEKAAAAYEAGAYDLDFFRERKLKITAEQAELKKLIAETRARLNGCIPPEEIQRRVQAKMKAAVRLLQETDISRAKMYLQEIIDHILVKSEEDLTIFYRV
ncbi:MAG: site-specific recombinase [Thermoanaerobacter sp.]|nr:site-specific recombinase [Thermoanaerobacter sp.]